MTLRELRIERVEPYEDGRAWGEVGPYELITGTAHYALDPAAPANARITDLRHAERGADGLAHAEGDFRILRPAHPERANGGLFYSVVNRGNVTLPFGIGRAPDLLTLPPGTIPPSDGFLLQRGWTVAWSGWQFDLARGPRQLGLTVPQAVDAQGRPLAGMFRMELRPLADSPSMRLLDATAVMAGRTEPVYPPDGLDQSEASLAVREAPNAPRQLIPRERWQFAHEKDGHLEPSRAHVWLEGGFRAGQVYELIYRTAHCPIAGFGFAAVRDFVSALRGGEAPARGLTPPISRVLGIGISQTGRWLRQYLREGLNVGESGRAVFDGLFIHIAGARGGEFNHRYAQPNEALAHGFGDLPPFAWEAEGGGLLDRQRAHGGVPKIVWVNSGWEYWRGDASLAHSTPDGAADLAEPANVRSYLMASTDHLTTNTEMARLMGIANEPTGVDPTPLLRALALHLDGWVAKGVEPPPSRVPRVAEGTAVPREAVLEAVRGFPGLHLPDAEALPSVPALDLGPEADQGIARWPAVTGPLCRALVSAVDADGNEVAGIRLPEVAVPVATLTGWNTQRSHARLAPLSAMPGSRLPFARTKAERLAAGDPRPSLEERYGSRAAYRAQLAAAADALCAEGFLLPWDRDHAIAAALAGWDAICGAPGA